MPRLLCVTCFIACVAAAANTAAAAGDIPLGGNALDGLRFTGHTGEKGKGDHHADTIMFQDGMFRSLDCENWGFGAGSYTVEKRGDTYHFGSTLLSPDRGRLEWTGKIAGDKATATFRWTHERWYWTIRRDYWFKGTRQADKR